jgi:hypothetical protein
VVVRRYYLEKKHRRRFWRRTFYLSLVAQCGQLYSQAITLLDPYECGGKGILMQRGWRVLSSGAGVSPAFLRFVNAAKSRVQRHIAVISSDPDRGEKNVLEIML